jgi:uncharacterized protein (DUF1330 family)
MSTYFIATSTVTDPEKLSAYETAAGATLAGRDISLRAVTREAKVIEGTSPGTRVVVLEFPDEAAFREWYDSPEYQAILSQRLESTDGFAVLVEGMS